MPLTFKLLKLVSFTPCILAMGACSTSPKTISPLVTSTQTDRIFSGDYSSPIWLSDKFKGTHKRTLKDSRLELQLTELDGGMDTAVAGTDRSGIKADDIDDNLQVCMRLNIDTDGFWWAGPKLSINWQSMIEPGHGIWYENYVIDNASLSPAEMENWVFEIHNGQAIGQTVHDGSVYKHYLIHYKSWKQYWAVRQDYRTVGITSLKPIVNKWRQKGMENKEFDGVKLNIEFHGPATAQVVIEGSIPKDYQNASTGPVHTTCQ